MVAERKEYLALYLPLIFARAQIVIPRTTHHYTVERKAEHLSEHETVIDFTEGSNFNKESPTQVLHDIFCTSMCSRAEEYIKTISYREEAVINLSCTEHR